MNRLEKIVYDAVKSKPWLKLLIRNIYQRVFDILPTPKEYSIAPILLKEGYFYGFHDVIPFSTDDSKVLANKLYIDLKMPSSKDIIDVGYFKFNNGALGEYHKIDQSNAWNYHKGCRLQWLGDKRIIYNTTADGLIVSKIFNLEHHKFNTVHYPIDSTSPCGNYATTFSYERLEKYMPGYGYVHKDDDSYLEQQSPKQTGLFLVDLVSGTRELLLSLQELSEHAVNEEHAKDSFHYVTHSLFSPNGKYISFFHRWVGGDTRKRYTRLIIYDLEKRWFSIVPTGYMVSHYVWNENNDIIAYCNYNSIDSHVLIKVPNFGDSHQVAYPELNSDGHQSFITPDAFVTDTYADKRRMAKLYHVNVANNNVKLLASVFSSGKFQTKVPHKHIACDLHPRVSKSGKYVCFDTVKTGKRALAIMSIQ